MSRKKKIKEVILLTKTYLQQEKERGVKFVKEPAISVPANKTKASPAAGKTTKKMEPTLSEFHESMKNCRKCKLSKTRIKLVFGQGNPSARLMFVGEGPGYDEDRQGLPFIGKAGQLLTKIINAMNLQREDVYIANIVKCHPLKDPSNIETRGNDRAPDAEEIKSCIPYLLKQIAIIKPEIIVTLGAPSTKTLLGLAKGEAYAKTLSITKIRGQLLDFEGTKLMPTFHPAYLLRDPHKKKDVWEDMQKVMSILKL